MSTLILGITLQDLAGAVLCIPLAAGLIILATRLSGSGDGGGRALPLVKTLGLGAPLASAAFILLMAYMMDGARDGVLLGPFFDWLPVQKGAFDVAFWLDPLSFTFSLLIAFLAFLMGLYVLSERTPGQPLADRLGLFNVLLFASLLIIWSDSITLIYLGWETMAIAATFLLRGGKTLFWLSRLGSLAFLAAIFISFAWFINEVPEVTQVRLTFALLEEYRHQLPPGILYFWLFAAGIYATQFPASIWLWRSADRPMQTLAWLCCLSFVTAGIYLMIRLNFLILTEESAWLILEWVGAITAFIGALGALGQSSLRRLLAYATVSQAGFVVCAFGTGAYYYGILHWMVSLQAILLLFWSLGMLTNQEETDDLFQIGAYRRRFPLAFIGTVLGAVTLIGALPLVGFFSRTGILWNLFTQDRLFAGIMTALASVITALYAAKLIGTVFLGPAPAAGAGKVSGRTGMGLPVVALIVMSLGMIWYALPELYWGGDHLRNWLLPVFEDHLPIRSELYGRPLQRIVGLIVGSSLLLITVVTCLLYAFKRDWMTRPRRSTRFLRRIAARDAYVYEFLVRIFVRPIQNICQVFVSQILEANLLDGLIWGGIASGTQMMGRGLARLQSGRVQHYLVWFLLGAGALVVWVCA